MGKYIFNLGQLFSENSVFFSQRKALSYADKSSVDFLELEIISNRIAHFLVSKNISKSDVVAILNDKSTYAIGTMLACLKIGAIYTNLDNTSPKDRIDKMIKISNPKLIFTNENPIILALLVDFEHSNIVEYSSKEFIEQIFTYQSTLPKENGLITGKDPAYLMFTSGSTGFPKGVVISHQNVLNFIEWSKSVFNTSAEDIFTNINPMHFDNSVFDFYASLFTGACMLPISSDLIKNPRKLLDILNQLNPTVWFSVPSMLVFALKLRALKENDLENLRIVSFGGEGFPKNQLRNLWRLWGNRVQFLNVYGPTECTCICSSYQVTELDLENDELLPLGPIAANFDFIILDELNNEVKDGETGELYIGGSNVGLGYYDLIEKTNEVFIQNPLNNKFKEIIYKSGDLVYFNSEKNLLYFKGRKDNQIKRMGYRIELEEIENSINSLDYTEECAIIYHKSDENNGVIVACLNSSIKDEQKILIDISSIIPSYMLPNKFVFYEDLPKNKNGKIDRLKLKEEYLYEK